MLSAALLLLLLLSSVVVLASVSPAAAGGEDGSDHADRLSHEPPRRRASEEEEEDGGVGRGRAAAAAAPSDPSLGPDSVVLITGAAGFVGSELALALRRVYRVRRLLLVDNLGIESEAGSAYVPPPSGGSPATRKVYERYGEEELSAFEIKRQRLFRVFQELTAADFYDEDEDGGDGGGLRGLDSMRLYRADLRPSIPEFFDIGEVPLLEGIFQSHPDITHVVHLADVPLSGQNQAVPRSKDSIKTGPMEAVLEEFRLMLLRGGGPSSSSPEAKADPAAASAAASVRLPHLVYASSHEVYDWLSTADAPVDRDGRPLNSPNPPPFREDLPITTPSTLHGTNKLMDEMLAASYHSTHGIYSVGLRFFPVYGPWCSPDSEVYGVSVSTLDAAAGEGSGDEDGAFEGDVRDYVYIDDAVDAVLAAMQYRPGGEDPPAVVANVGTGKGSTLRDIREELAGHFPGLKGQTPKAAAGEGERRATVSIASAERSESILGFKARTSLREGLAQTLEWQRDRQFPYGPDPRSPAGLDPGDGGPEPDEAAAAAAREARRLRDEDRAVSDSLLDASGVDECSPLDRDCLRGSPAFPCASECAKEWRCTPSPWDDAAALSSAVTAGCDAVLYTVALDGGLEGIPSAESEDSSSFVGAGLAGDVGRRTRARCNVAFVSDSSPLVGRLRDGGKVYTDDEDETGLPPLLRHGPWTVLPVPSPDGEKSGWLHSFSGTYSLEHLPKLSPGRFFGRSVRIAAYVGPDVVADDLPGLLKRMDDGPPKGRTALMVPESVWGGRGHAIIGGDGTTAPGRNDRVQTLVYNAVRIAVRGDLLGGGPRPALDTSLVVHNLPSEDSRLFRCDSYAETAAWGASSDGHGLEFMASLHDLWSRAVNSWTGHGTWWTGDDGGDGAGDGGGEESDANPANGTPWLGVLSSDDQLFVDVLPPGVIRRVDGGA